MKIRPTKWEECRGLGRSFGCNRAEGEAETIAPDALIYPLADIVSKNDLYAILLGKPQHPEVTLLNVKAKCGTALHLLGDTHPLKWRAEGENVKFELPTSLPGQYAYVLRLQAVGAP